jgi:hypothetical protein
LGAERAPCNTPNLPYVHEPSELSGPQEGDRKDLSVKQLIVLQDKWYPLEQIEFAQS